MIILSSTLLSCAAQKSSYNEGYIINHNRDTLRGFIKDRSPEPFVELYNNIRFKPEANKGKKKYSAYDILGYGYYGEQFLSVHYRTEQYMWRTFYYADSSAGKSFFKLIEYSNKLIYLEKEYIHDDNSYPDYFPVFLKPSTNQIVRVTQGILGFKKNRLAEFFYDCPEVVNAIQNNDPSLRTVLDLYNYYLYRCR